MKKALLLTLLSVLMFFSLHIQAQKEDRKPLTIGDIRTLHSNILHEDRILNIYLPEKYDPSKSYPVIYLLDGPFKIEGSLRKKGFKKVLSN